jgi:hypothetical protein
MLAWILAALAGTALALWSYRAREGGWRRTAPPAALRAIVITLAIAILAGAPSAPARPPAPLVVFDVSSSWRRAGDSAAWHAARARAAALSPDTLWLLGDSLRAGVPPAEPADAATRAAPAAERARASGRPLVLLTDGEVDDAPSLTSLPPRSRAELFARAPRIDLGLADVEAPASAVAGDTIEVRVTVSAGDLPVARAALSLRDGAGRVLAARTLDTLPAHGERVVVLRVTAPAAAGGALLTAIVSASGDAEVRNDSATVALDVSRAAGAVFVSSAPDEEIRFLVPVLRGALSLPARGFYRVAPGAWRREGTLEPVSESEVRAALRSAPIALIHGDTALFGAPRAAASGALLLLPEGGAGGGEWFATAAPASPVAGALAGTAWDSLPPVSVSERAPEGEWSALTVARVRRYDARAAIAGAERGRRVVVAGASGFWRWRFRGGASATAYDALWGGILDWLAAERRDARAAVPSERLLRSGEPVRWRRGAAGANAGDSLVMVLLRRRGGGAADTVVLRFAAGVSSAESHPLAPGVYDARTTGGVSVLAVNASREWLPRPPTVRAGEVGSAASAARTDAPLLRDRGWAYLLAIAALCAEWLLRRRAGLR